MAQNTSCLRLKVSSCEYYIDFVTKKCVQSCSSATSLPKIINGTLYCTQTDSDSASNYVRVDSSIYTASNGQKTVFFVLDQNVATNN